MQEELKFKISAALKDIIGKDLITDDFMAVFELVKNSFDAHATQVDIIFENIYSENSKIIIKDNGKGMNYSDLINKWLFVAYSAKKEGTEDDSFDYRDKIYSNRHYAGAKGIGRFSCDRLGKTLYLETKKNEPNSKVEILFTDWEKFEGDLKQEFININVLHETKTESSYGIIHGTALVISDLRSQWNRNDFLKLKESLAKLITPNKANNENNFSININVLDEIETDKHFEEYHQKVNGPVSNFIFHALDFRTTKIQSSISNDGKQITTKLTDGGTLIYEIKEINKWELLSHIDSTIYYMNMSAKQTFARRMGLSSNRFGHIFLYKNGFRIYPYGEPGEDTFKIDARKSQGRNRYLGTTDLLGQIELSINDNQVREPSMVLKETSSRGDGLIKTKAYFQLEAYFLETLKRLEKYVVEVQQWGISIEDESSYGVKTRVSDLIAKLTGSNDITDFKTDDNFYQILEASQNNSANAIVNNLHKIALGSGDEALIEQVKKASIKLLEIQTAREESERESKEEQKRAFEATEKLREQISENLFLKSINTTEFQEVISLIHHIGIYAGTIDNNLKGISLRVQNDIPLSNDELYDIVRSISFETKKILNVAAFATKSKFKLDTEQKEINLNEYIREYIQNIIPTTTDKSLNISVRDFALKPHIKILKPIELNIVVDNIINNAKKAGATKLIVEINENDDGKLEIKFIDNGSGIKEENIKRIYDFGFTTTDGSGIGLFHVKEIMKSIGGSINAESNESEGTTFTIQFK
ncbi:MAG TPA: sensor histidine kinase [Saprospiraceae bacterium]|nr:sensor histidine kinase [Saprospiraceae bacterium]